MTSFATIEDSRRKKPGLGDLAPYACENLPKMTPSVMAQRIACGVDVSYRAAWLPGKCVIGCCPSFAILPEGFCPSHNMAALLLMQRVNERSTDGHSNEE